MNLVNESTLGTTVPSPGDSAAAQAAEISPGRRRFMGDFVLLRPHRQKAGLKTAFNSAAMGAVGNLIVDKKGVVLKSRLSPGRLTGAGARKNAWIASVMRAEALLPYLLFFVLFFMLFLLCLFTVLSPGHRDPATRKLALYALPVLAVPLLAACAALRPRRWRFSAGQISNPRLEASHPGMNGVAFDVALKKRKSGGAGSPVQAAADSAVVVFQAGTWEAASDLVRRLSHHASPSGEPR
jgi:hypothetical protein